VTQNRVGTEGIGTDAADAAATAGAPNLRSLIERLEAATVGGRESDAKIYYCINLPHSEQWPSTHRWVSMAPSYTTSIDAALTLLAPAWRILALNEAAENVGWGNEKWWWRAQVLSIGARGGANIHSADAPTAPLALCAAALKARAAVEVAQRAAAESGVSSKPE
jgi:hypothetical protein